VVREARPLAAPLQQVGRDEAAPVDLDGVPGAAEARRELAGAGVTAVGLMVERPMLNPRELLGGRHL